MSETEIDELLGALTGSTKSYGYGSQAGSMRGNSTASSKPAPAGSDAVYGYLDDFLLEMEGQSASPTPRASMNPSKFSTTSATYSNAPALSNSGDNLMSELDEFLNDSTFQPPPPPPLDDGFGEWETVSDAPAPEDFGEWAPVDETLPEPPEIDPFDKILNLDSLTTKPAQNKIASAPNNATFRPKASGSPAPVTAVQPSQRKTNQPATKKPVVAGGAGVAQTRENLNLNQTLQKPPPAHASPTTVEDRKSVRKVVTNADASQQQAGFANVAAQMAANKTLRSAAGSPATGRANTPASPSTPTQKQAQTPVAVENPTQRRVQQTQQPAGGVKAGGAQNTNTGPQGLPALPALRPLGPAPGSGSGASSRGTTSIDKGLVSQLDSMIQQNNSAAGAGGNSNYNTYKSQPAPAPAPARSAAFELSELESVLGVDTSDITPESTQRNTSGPSGFEKMNGYIVPQMKYYNTDVAEGIRAFLVDDTIGSPTAGPGPTDGDGPWHEGVTVQPRQQLQRVDSQMLDNILAGVDPDVDKRQAEREKQKRMEDLLGGLNDDYLTPTQRKEVERKKAEEEERKRREEEQRRRQEQFIDLDEIASVITEAFPLKFFDDTLKPSNPKTRVEESLENRYNRLIEITGVRLWSPTGQLDVNPITAALKDNVTEAREAASSEIVDKPVKDYVVNTAKEALNATTPFIAAVKALNEEVASSPQGVARVRGHKLVEDVRNRRIGMLQSHRDLLHSILSLRKREDRVKELTASGATINHNAMNNNRTNPNLSMHPADIGVNPFVKPTIPPLQEAKNNILQAFRDFYVVEQAPKPNTMESLNYIPWKPEKSLLQYTQISTQDFKAIIDEINKPPSQLDFLSFAAKIVGELRLLVPVVKILRMDTMKYRNFSNFANDVKMFVNSVLKFNDAVDVAKKKVGAAPGDPDMVRASHAQQDLIKSLRGLLSTLRQIIVMESG